MLPTEAREVSQLVKRTSRLCPDRMQQSMAQAHRVPVVDDMPGLWHSPVVVSSKSRVADSGAAECVHLHLHSGMMLPRDSSSAMVATDDMHLQAILKGFDM